MYKGYLCLTLHAHLPYVRHPEEEYFLEENWLYEAMTETYIPLINAFENLVRDKVDFRITMSMTPTLCSMLQDPLLQSRYLRHLNKLIELAEKELHRTGFQPEFHGVALMYHRRLTESKAIFRKYNYDLVQAFKRFQNMGYIEIITCGATHGFLPLLNVNPASVRAQIFIGAEHYTKTFGRPPKGIWLPECGYFPGLDKVLKEAGIRYFFADSHGVLNSDPVPRNSVYAPIYCPSGVAAFGRDWESSKQVWSSKEGYPGDANYREYYKDIGFELDYDYIKPYIHPSGLRVNTGFKYWRITGNSHYKEAYMPDNAKNKAAEHAGNFMFNREKQIEHLISRMSRKPIIVAPYDAELFGHWWFEGPLWIEFLARKIYHDQNIVKMITPSEYLTEYPVNQVCQPSASSWGYQGYNDFWVNCSNDWIYKHLEICGKRMAEAANKYAKYLNKKGNSLYKRALNQAGRELVLSEASDWAFIMKTGTMVPYAHKRTKVHLNRFNKLYSDITNGTVDKEWLTKVEYLDNIFHSIDTAKYYLDKKKFNIRKPAKAGRVKKKKLKTKEKVNV